MLEERLAALQGDVAFAEVIEQSRKIGLNATILTYVTGATEDKSVQIESTSRSLERLFDQVGNRVGAGLHEKLWRRLREADSEMTADTAQLTVIAVLRSDGTIIAVETRARELFEEWMSEYGDAIEGLGESEQEEIDRLREAADEPSARGVHLPLNISSRRTKKSTDWPNHLFVDDDGYFPETLNDWEKDVLETEMKRDDHLCWLRNKDRQKWAIAFPYDKTTTEKSAAYPDFVFFREGLGGVKIDLVDPHGIHLPDAPAKARGFAQYAKAHGGLFDRIEMVIYEPDTDRRRGLNLKSITVRDQVLKVTTTGHLQALFDLAGS